jgi:hypothetical protein
MEVKQWAIIMEFLTKQPVITKRDQMVLRTFLI